jgi:hypothetical protein
MKILSIGGLIRTGDAGSLASLALTAGTASTSTTTGTLIVTGGVGVSGDVFVGSQVVAGSTSGVRLGISSSQYCIWAGLSTGAANSTVALVATDWGSYSMLNVPTGGTVYLRVNNANQFQANVNGFGYPTGRGGAVTQATSRTTGVTLNTVCGAITLVSAAGSTSWQTFTVTNSTVAATDTVLVVQKAGTDKNMIFVTAVAAGSFAITFATTGGTTVEQPVFNFAVVKAVAS